MDKIARIKRIVKTSLDTSFKGGIIVKEITVLPTHKYDETTKEWVPDSHSVFLVINRPDDPKLNEEIYSALGLTDASTRIADYLESLLGLEVCVHSY